jgi:hypothetical protein
MKTLSSEMIRAAAALLGLQLCAEEVRMTGMSARWGREDP